MEMLLALLTISLCINFFCFWRIYKLQDEVNEYDWQEIERNVEALKRQDKGCTRERDRFVNRLRKRGL